MNVALRGAGVRSRAGRLARRLRCSVRTEAHGTRKGGIGGWIEQKQNT
jgi:hypothetical protein